MPWPKPITQPQVEARQGVRGRARPGAEQCRKRVLLNLFFSCVVFVFVSFSPLGLHFPLVPWLLAFGLCGLCDICGCWPLFDSRLAFDWPRWAADICAHELVCGCYPPSGPGVAAASLWPRCAATSSLVKCEVKGHILMMLNTGPMYRPSALFAAHQVSFGDFGPFASVDSFCHPCITTTRLSYSCWRRAEGPVGGSTIVPFSMSFSWVGLGGWVGC